MDAARRTLINEALVQLADGDRAALRILMDELWPVILGFANRMIGEQADAEDVAQETLIKIAARIADFDRKRDGLTWAYAIAAYEIRTWRRKRFRRKEVPHLPEMEAHMPRSPSTEDAVAEDQLKQALLDALGNLSDTDREALGISEPTQVSSDVPDVTIRKRRQRAVGRLRALWSELYG